MNVIETMNTRMKMREGHMKRGVFAAAPIAVRLIGCMSGRTDQRPSGGTSRQRTFGTIFLNFFTFEIDIWGRLRRATEAARAELLATDWNRKVVITTLISDVASAYFTLLELDMEIAIARDTLGTREE